MNYKNIKEEEEVGNKVGSNFFKTSDTPETTDKATNPALKGRHNLRLGAAFPNLRIGITPPKALKGRYNLRLGIAHPNLSLGITPPKALKVRYNLRLGTALPNLRLGIALPNLSMGAALPNKL
jgi:hypothetical protein